MRVASGYPSPMAEIAVCFSSEERSAPEIVAAAAHAERAGFRSRSVSDHLQPCNDEQGRARLSASGQRSPKMCSLSASPLPTPSRKR